MSYPHGGAINIWRDSNNPNKGEIRDWGGSIEEGLSSLELDIDDIRDQAGSGLVAAATWADLSAFAPALDNQAAEVSIDDTGTHADATATGYDGPSVSNSGRFAWNATWARWMRVGDLGLSGKASIVAEARINAPMIGTRPLILDGRNFLAGGSAVYVPRIMTFRHSGITVFTAVLPADSKLSDWHKVPITPTASVQVIYYDVVSQAVLVAPNQDAPVDVVRYHRIATIYGSSNERGEGVSSSFAVHEVEDSGASVYATAGPLYFDAAERQLHIPACEGLTFAAASWTLTADDVNASRRVIDLPESDYWHVWIDTAAIADTSPSDASAVVVTTTAALAGAKLANRSGAAGMVLVASGRGDSISPGPAFRVAPVAANECSYGKDAIADQDFQSVTFAARAITDASLLALGFDQGVYSTKASDRVVFIGSETLANSGSGYLFYRFFIEADVAGEFGVPRVYFQYVDTDGSYAYDRVDVTTYRAHSTTAREYYGVIEMPTDHNYTRVLPGGYFENEDCAVTGVQFAWSASPDVYVSAADYPSPGYGLSDRIANLEAAAGGSVRENQFLFGREAVGDQVIYSSALEIVDITDAGLLALGFTQGVHSTAVSKTVFSGGPLSNNTGEGYLFYRFYVEAETAGEFGVPRVYFQYRVGAGDTEHGRLKYDYVDINDQSYREISATAREYYGVVELSGDQDYIGALAGGFFDGEDCIITGVQFAWGLTSKVHVERGDYPQPGETLESRVMALEAVAGEVKRTADPLLFPHIYCIEGRSFEIHPDQMSRKAMPGSMRFAMSSSSDRPRTATSYGSSITFDDSFAGSTLSMFFQDLYLEPDGNTVYRNIPIHRATEAEVAALGSIKVHSIGDSLTESYVFAFYVKLMQDMGVTVSTIGTIVQDCTTISGTPAVTGEGRGGTGLNDFTGRKKDEMAVPSSPAVYLAEDDEGRKALNPYLRDATGGDDPAMVFDGKIFDFGYYLSTYAASEVPDVVWLAHAFNTVTDYYWDEDGLRTVFDLDLTHVIASIRAAAPDATIVIPSYAIGRFERNARWDGNQSVAIEQTMSTLEVIDDDNIVFVPGHVLMGRDTAFDWAAIETLPHGALVVGAEDFTHPWAAGIRQVCEPAMQFTLAKLATV